MKTFLLISFLAFLFIGCVTTTTQIASVTPEQLKAEEEQQRIIVIQELSKQQQRLDSLFFPLIMAATNINQTKVGPFYGLRFDHALKYSPEWQIAARKIGMGDTLMVSNVTPNSPAAKAGFVKGDLILAINSVQIPVSKEAIEIVKKSFLNTINGNSSIRYLRNGISQEVTIAPLMISRVGNIVNVEGGINAYADGENIIVPWTMMRFANDQELTVIISHEIAHNIMGHIDARRQNAALAGLVGLLGDVAMASRGYNTGGTYTEQFMAMGAQAFSRDFEREADYVGLYIMARAGLPLENAPKLWRYFAQIDPKAIGYATTHPTTAERFVILQQTIKEIKRKLDQGLPLLPEKKTENIKSYY